MMIGVLLIATALIGQVDAPVEGVVYEVYYTDDGHDSTVYGSVHEVAEGHYEVVLDEPWQSNPRKFFVTERNIVDLKEEDAAHRQRRHEEGWQAAGYVMVETLYGPQAVPRTDAELAERARAMDEAAALKDQPVEAPPVVAADAEPLPAPGFLEQWWAHLTMALVTLVLVAAIAVTLIFR
jgi:hypothetical protein